MDTAAQPTLERTEKSFGSYIESLTRLTAASLALMYGIGFFILSLHEARFGILQFSPLRARILFVGFTFMLLAALPIAANKYKIAYFGPVKPVLENTDPLLSGQRGMFLKSAFVYTAILIAMLVHPFLFVNVSLSKPPLGRWSWLLVVIFLAGIWAVTRIWSYLARDFVSRPTRAAVLSLLASGAVLGGIYLLYSGVASLALWMFVVVFVVGD